jgi:hypothetical protein
LLAGNCCRIFNFGYSGDKDLIFDIHCCINQDGVFVIEFRRTRGNAFIIAEIFHDLRKLLGSRYDDDEESDDEESDDETTLPATCLPVSGNYNPPVAGTSSYKFNFDDLI